jgi:hypothetical protein
MLQHLQSLALALSAIAEQIREPEQEQEPVHVTKQDEEEEDDRVSVKETVEIIEGPPEPVTQSTPTATSVNETDEDDIHDKTAAELRDLLTKKGIPFGKRDSKAVLLQLLKATS